MCVKFGFVGAKRSYAFLVHSFSYALFYFRESKRQRGNALKNFIFSIAHKIEYEYENAERLSIRQPFYLYPYFSVKTTPQIISAPPKYCAMLIASFKSNAPRIIVVTGSSAEIMPAVEAPSYLTPS